MFSLMELLLPARPRTLEAAEACLLQTPVPDKSAKDGPVVCIQAEGGGVAPVSVVARRELVSVAVAEHQQSLSLFPDGRMLVRAEDNVFQTRPGREGAQLISAGTSVTIGQDGDVIVVGDGFTVIIDALGRVFRQDEVDCATDRPGPPEKGDRAIEANVLRFPACRPSTRD